MTPTASLKQLRKSGHRLTPQRLAIMEILEQTHGHMSAAEIYHAASLRLPGLTEATVYRTLDFLVANGLALVAHIGSGRMVYESGQLDHHHLICRKCGSSAEIDQAELVALFGHFEQSTGYHIDASHVTFFGLCPDCLSKEGSTIPDQKA